MGEIVIKPKMVIETDPTGGGALIIGEDSPAALTLREILSSQGVKINDFRNFNYIFQLGDFGKVEFFLKKAVSTGAKFFLILNESSNNKLAKKAEEKTLEFIQTQKLGAKIIKLSGLTGQEIEVAKRILKVAFSQTTPKVIVLDGIDKLWELDKKKQDNEVLKKIVSWGLSAGFLIFFVTLPITFILANLFLGVLALKQAQEKVFSSALEKGKEKSLVAQKHFAIAKNSFGKITPIFSFLGKETQAKKIDNWLEVGQDLGQGIEHLIRVGQEGQKLARLILNQEQGKIDEVLVKMTDDISLAEEELALVEARIDKQSFILTKFKFLKENFEQIKSLRKNLVKTKSILGAAPWILGLGEQKAYLVLFQNNFELRPGGGFIGSIGFLNFNEGKMDLKIEDVYTADGQLRGHVEPPEPIRNHFNQAHWYLRDSNWEPDFPANAQKASWFLEKEMGIKTDGVIAIDLALVKKILAISGPIDLVDYQEKIGSDNLFLKAQVYSQENFFPGSTQKRDFLGGLADALFNKLETEKNLSWFAIGKAIEEAAAEKHLFVFFKNDPIQRVISDQGFGGEVKNATCNMQHVTCLEDYLMVLEANLGVNKVNYFLKREIKKETEVKDNFLFSKIVLNYENTSPANVSFGGTYKNYLRILTPTNFVLEKININSKNLDLNKEVDKTISFGKSVTGFLVEIPLGTKKEIEVFYRMPFDLPNGEFTYQLLVQKQPGTEKDPFSLVITLPWQILETNFPTARLPAPDAAGYGGQVAKKGIISYNSDLSVDRIFKIKFKK